MQVDIQVGAHPLSGFFCQFILANLVVFIASYVAVEVYADYLRENSITLLAEP